MAWSSVGVGSSCGAAVPSFASASRLRRGFLRDRLIHQRQRRARTPRALVERLDWMRGTLDTYSHAIPAMQEEAAALIAGLVFADVPAAS